MKFKVTVDGKDSIREGLLEPVRQALVARGVRPPRPKWIGDHDEWDREFEHEQERMAAFVLQFLKDGDGGNDSVTVEVDTESGTCVIVPLVQKIKPY